jgi:phosphonate metabolism protein PhnN/1,5-bisphosphokinase (PRPP-forming)
MGGALVLVVGPSGAGKDTLIAGARSALRADPRFSFPRRTVTRIAHAELEDHDSIAPADFERQTLCGAFALDWEAHGLRYGIPVAIEAALAHGQTVVVNVSRRAIAQAIERYRDVMVVMVTAAPEVRAARLAMRGREAEADILERLSRPAPDLPEGARVLEIDNSGGLDAGTAAFLAALRRAAGEP